MRYFLFAILLAGVVSCKQRAVDYQLVLHNPVLYSKVTGQLTDVITYDIFTPPVASRIYAYSHLAAYEAMVHGDSSYTSLKGQLKGFDYVLPPDSGKIVDYPYAALMAFMEVGRTLTFSKDQTDKIVDSLKMLATEHGMPADMKKNSEEYGVTVAKAVMAWSKKDNYAQTRSAAKYTVPNDEGKWIPTPPGYFQAVEPQWKTIRTIAMDSSSQFSPPTPCAFGKDSTCAFYKMAKQVQDTGVLLTEEQKAIASFWDCNGFKLNVVGHTMYATKAMTPGGHWMGITGIICDNKKADFEKTVYTYTTVSFAVMDAFIACWDAKYTFNVIRPETVINKYIDANWKPFLQTPPFPEYTSGHSIISTAASTVLEHIYGAQTPFRDSTERPWGFPDRNFQTPRQAADEAGISRFYGGIHYRPSILVARDQGEKVGNYIFSKLAMRKEQLASK
ncbi:MULTISPECIES: vanadium-dependent haloperoxidase [Niastella]|uniref:Vanadium-dependent haloperoxidase n=1 Tax=Niastella soli TaxID=2821487 RepID=A0ABS3YQB8_9BACT|nr:vanadium-dependent haloperoxidase [Niastella soli]MBO9200087.1 vanadium-dependent haloperoxidase [Niastella soli]